MEQKRVVVTGMGAITPIGNTLPEFWENIKNGVSGAAPIARFDASTFKTKFACEVKNYDPLKYFDRKESRKIDLYTQYALIAAEEAFKDANLEVEKIDHDNFGVIWGSGIGGIETFENEMRDFHASAGNPRISPFFIPKMISNIAAGYISIKYQLRGPNFTTVTACASASHAIANAFYYIKLGKAKMFITGGSEAACTPAGVAGFNAMHALSTRNDDPKTASRPFDVDRDGFVIGEGGGALIVEDYDHAVQRGAKIYAEIIGAGMSADAHHITAPHPEGYGACLVMRLALKDAELRPEDIEYINVHGTSTDLGDIAESIAIKEVFKEHAYNLSISSTKSMTGHLLGAAGAVEGIATIMGLKEGIIPPTINHFNLDPKIDSKLDFTFNKAKVRNMNIAISNTFGFGGQNGTLVFKKFNQ